MTYEEYQAIERERMAINIAHLEAGVNFIDIRTAYIGENVKIGAGTVIYPGVTLEGDTVIGNDCIIGQNSRICDSLIDDETDVQFSVIIKSSVGKRTHIGPFAYLRPDSKIGDGCKVGDFVEVKNSALGDGSKASHLTYIGDSDVGRGVNLGCGVVFVNYDGKQKHRSIVEDHAFIGCNVNLISPVTVKENAYVAAGSTVTEDVPAGALCIARERQKNVEGWTEKKGLLHAKEER